MRHVLEGAIGRHTTWNQYETVLPSSKNGINLNTHLYKPRRILDHVPQQIANNLSPKSNDQKLDPEPNPNNQDSSISVPNPNISYVVNFKYPGQQGAGVRAIASFQCFLGSINQQLSIVEPYVEGTNFRGYTNDDTNNIKFSDIFDFGHFNAASRERGYAELVKMEEFVRWSPKYTILFLIKTAGSKRVIWTSEFGSEGVKCLREMDMERLDTEDQQAIVNSQEMLYKIKRKGVCIVRVIAMDAHWKKEQTLEHTTRFIFDQWLPQEVTLIFNFWSEYSSFPISTSVNGINCKLEFITNGTKYQFQPSQRLLRDARIYEERFLGGNNSIAVMIRVERTLEYLKERRSERKIGDLTECFKEVMNLTKEIAGPLVLPLVTMDIGRYGSRSFNKKKRDKNIVDISKDMLRTLYQNKWSFKSWEKSFIQASDGTTNSGYIGALQRTLASRAKCLILMGGGNYQALAVQNYIDNHEEEMKNCIHLVCAISKKNTFVQRKIKNYKHENGR